MRLLILSVGLLWMCPGRSAEPYQAKARPTERSEAAASLFSESVLAVNGAERLVRLNGHSVEQQLAGLQDWVLPNDTHGFRLNGWFSPIDRRPQSPALRLIQLSKTNGQLDDLTALVKSLDAQEERDQRGKAALLALIAAALSDVDSITAQLTDLQEHAAANPTHSLQDRWPEILVCDALRYLDGDAPALAPAHAAAEELLLILQPKARSDQMSVEAAHLLSLRSHFQRMRESGRADINTEVNSIAHHHKSDSMSSGLHWSPVDRVDEASLLSARPDGSWWIRKNEATCVASHYCESLYWSVPLQGEVQVEAEVTSVPYARGHLGWGGHWVAVPDKARLLTGRFWSGTNATKIEPPLTDMDGWSRYRMKVDGQNVHTWLNGRHIEHHRVSVNADPWLCIRNMWMHNSGVRNVRITGSPTIPDQISLLTGEDLPGWNSFYATHGWTQVAADLSTTIEPLNGANSQLPADSSADNSANVELRSDVQPDLLGTHAESLLYYHRPMLEDGVIEYEFYFEPDAYDVHPAIGTDVFMLTASGVDLYSVHPAGQSMVGAKRIGKSSSETQLKPESWNKLRISLTGTELTVAVNDVDAGTFDISSVARRKFGLFHFRDQTSARVRNVVWRGDWPKQLPTLADQKLAAPDLEFLNGLDELREVMHHDFALHGVSEERFRVDGESRSTAIHETVLGTRITPTADGTWRGIWVKLKEPIYGDFDAVLSFTDLVFEYGESDYLDMELRGIDASGLEMKATRQMHGTNDEFRAKLDQQLSDGSWVSDSVHLRDESTSGRLRLIRRGDTCHMLIAHDDSPNFHYCGSRQVFSADSMMRVEILVKCAGGGSASVVLRELTVRSNSRAEADRRDLRISGLENFTYRLRARRIHNFARVGMTDFDVTDNVTHSSDGLLAVTKSASDRATVRYKTVLDSDFDVSVALSTEQLRIGCQATLGFDVDEKDPVGILIRRAADDQLRITGDVVSPNGVPVYVDTNANVGELRLIRVQKSLFLIYSLEGASRLLGICDYSDEPGFVTLGTQSAGPQQSAVNWKTFRCSVSAN